MKHLLVVSLVLLSFTGCSSMYSGTQPENNADDDSLRFHDPVHPDGTHYRCITQWGKSIWCENRTEMKGPQ